MKEKALILTQIARAAISKQLSLPYQEPDTSQLTWLQEDAATFVSLHKHGDLRGCIGSLQAHRTLQEDITNNALHAAFHDPRFPPLDAAELEKVDIEVSVLSKPEPMTFVSEADVLSQLQPHIDGVILSYGYNSGTFLPQVWQQLRDPELFLNHLKQKAGLLADFWHPDVQLSRYKVHVFNEPSNTEKVKDD